MSIILLNTSFNVSFSLNLIVFGSFPSLIVFKYNSYDCFDVEGKLVVDGTESQPVVFTHEYDDNYGNPKDTNTDGAATSPSINSSYYCLDFADISDDASTVTHAIFRYRNAGINLRQAAPSVTHCTFDQNNWGLILDGQSTPVVENNTFNNLTYAPMQISLVSYPSSLTGNVISGTTFRAIGVLSETLTQDVTLEKQTFAGIENIPYYFHGDYTIGTSVTLSIKPGVVLKFAGYRDLTVQKGLIAEGGSTADSTIIFTSIRDDFYGGDTNADGDATKPGYNTGWNGIHFEDVSLDPYCRLKYCIIKYAGRYSNSGAIITTSASPTITNSVITENRNGLIAKEASDPVINYCDIYDNNNLGVDNQGGSFVIDATNNWWGDNSGPTHSGNPGGSGQEVSDMVDYDPWLTSGANNPLMGDVSLNGLVQAFDASQILKYSVGSITLNDRQKQVADVSAAGGITAYDASLVLQYVVGLISYFPAEENNIIELSNPENIQTRQYLALQKTSGVIFRMGSVKAAPGNEIKIPLRIEKVDGVMAIQATFNFDSELLRFKEISLTEPFDDYYLVENFNAASGELKIALAGSKQFPEGILGYLLFDTPKDVTGKQQTTLDVVKFMANETDFSKSVNSAVIEIMGIPAEFKLTQNYPNPFNGMTKINYQLPENADVKIEIYNVVGQLVKTLIDAKKEAGSYELLWYGKNDLGQDVASGIYLIRMKSDKFVQTKKLHFLK